MPNPKKPTAIKELEGTWRADRHNPNEPRPPVELPDRPNWLDEDPRASRLFDQVTQYVKDMRLSTRVDGIALSMLCDQLSLYLEVREQIREEGVMITVTTKQSGTYEKPHPLLTSLNQAYGNIFKMLTQYGLTPVSRMNVSAAPEEDGNEFETFLNGS